MKKGLCQDMFIWRREKEEKREGRERREKRGEKRERREKKSTCHALGCHFS